MSLDERPRFEIALAEREDGSATAPVFGDSKLAQVAQSIAENGLAVAPLAPHGDRQVKLDTVVALMASGQWAPAKAIALAKQWGISLDTVRVITAEASRLLMYAGERDEIKASLMAGLEALRQRAEASEDPKAQANAIKAYELLTRIHGFEAPRQTELTVRVPTREEALRELRDAVKADPSIIEAVGELIEEG